MLNFMIKNRVAAHILMLFLVLGGIYNYFTIRQEVFPSIDTDIISISINYPGANPEEIDQSIIVLVEEKLKDIIGLKDIKSKANNGMATVSLELDNGVDVVKTYQKVEQAVKGMNNLPSGAETPVVSIVDINRQIANVIVYGDNFEVIQNHAFALKTKILKSKHVEKVDITNEKKRNINIYFDFKTLERYNITLDDIKNSVAKQSHELSAGEIKTKDKTILLRLNEKKYWENDFKNIVIKTYNGQFVTLEDIAMVKDELEDTNSIEKFNGKSGVTLVLYQKGDASPTVFMEDIKKILNEFSLPKDVNIEITDDKSIDFQQRLDLLLNNAMFSLVLVILILGLFLELKVALWVSFGIPVAFIGSFIFLPFYGISLNMLSMFAYIIVLGIVVDDAIMAGENIYEYRQRGYSFVDAALKGVNDIKVPLLFAVLTNIVAFIPLFFVEGMMGKFFWPIPAVVITTFAISLIESLLILPNHLAYSTISTNKIYLFIEHYQQIFAKKLDGFIEKWFHPLIIKSVEYKYFTISFFVGLLIIFSSIIMSGKMGFSMMPRIESDTLVVTAKLPAGTPLEKSEKIMNNLLSKGLAIGEKYPTLIKSYSHIATGETIRIKVSLPSVDIRPLSITEFANQWRKETLNIKGIDTLVFKTNAGPGGTQKSLSIELKHQDINVLKEASIIVAEEFKRLPLVSDVERSIDKGNKEYIIKLLPLAKQLSLSPTTIANELRSYFYGIKVLTFQRGEHEIEVNVKLNDKDINYEHALNTLKIKVDNTFIPLSQLITFEESLSEVSIERLNFNRVVKVDVEVNPEKESSKVLEAFKNEIYPKIAHLNIEYGVGGNQKDASDSLIGLIKGLAAVLFLIFIMLALPLESYVQPLIIMVAIPFGIIGAITGHLIMGYELSVISMLGIVALAGIVVNDTLVLIMYANEKIKEGLKVTEAIIMASTRRFRPIILTTLTTFIGLTPLMLEPSLQARFLIPMAISLAFGVLVSTLISLILVPSLYSVLVKDKK